MCCVLTTPWVNMRHWVYGDRDKKNFFLSPSIPLCKKQNSITFFFRNEDLLSGGKKKHPGAALFEFKAPDMVKWFIRCSCQQQTRHISKNWRRLMAIEPLLWKLSKQRAVTNWLQGAGWHADIQTCRHAESIAIWIRIYKAFIGLLSELTRRIRKRRRKKADRERKYYKV